MPKFYEIVLVCLGLHIFGFTAFVLGQDLPIVDTNFGTVQGSRHLDDGGREYEQYLGIPYATAPTGELRWQKPLPPQAWSDTLNATSFGAHCVQFAISSEKTSEDCLFLNVFVPGRANAITTPLPVMFFVHGGAYLAGTSAVFPSQALALHGNVIVVTINYRLSSIGFLTTGDEVCQGNYGLWDTIASLQWVQGNIEHFGGDPSSVTIFGHSAGAGVTSHIMITPQTGNLVHRGIPVSGAAAGFFGVSHLNSSVASTRALAKMFNCSIESSQEIRDCLMQESAEDLDLMGFVAATIYRLQLPNFMPIVDGSFLSEGSAFLPRWPAQMWEEGAGSQYDFMTGCTMQDAAGFVLFVPQNSSLFNGSEYGWATTNDTLYGAMRYITNIYEDPIAATEAVFNQYPDMKSEDGLERALGTTNAWTDWWFAAGAHYEAGMHSRSQRSTYLYEFAYDQSFLTYPDWVLAVHGDDLYSIFGEPYVQQNGQVSNDVDKQLSVDVMTYYTNFAHTGNPNTGPNAAPVVWNPYDTASMEYMQLAPSSAMKVEDAEMLNHYKFWNEDWHDIAIPRDPCGPTGDLCSTPQESVIDSSEVMERFAQLMWQQHGRSFLKFPDQWNSLESKVLEVLDRIEEKRQ